MSSWSKVTFSVSLLGLLAGCATAPAEVSVVSTPAPDAADQAIQAAKDEAAQQRRQLELDRQTLQFAAWQHVKAIAEMWRQLPEDYFPGIHGLIAEVDRLEDEIEQENSLLVGKVDPVGLTIRNPDYWRAQMETAPDDPVVSLFEQMLWATRGYFDRAMWLIDLQSNGPTLPVPVHRLSYSLADEMRDVRARENAGRSALVNNTAPEERANVVRAARQFQPGDPDWALTSLIMNLQGAGVNMRDLAATPALVSEVVRTNEADWAIVAQHTPLAGAQLHPDADVREAGREVARQLNALQESRDAFGNRDLQRLAEALAGAGLYSEALLANRRAVALRGFSVPGDIETWWRWLPALIGEDSAATLRTAMEAGEFRPVSFFQVDENPEGVAYLPLHPIVADRSLRRLQEVDRRLSRAGDNQAEVARSLVIRAETLGHLGRWTEAAASLDEIPAEYAAAADPMRVWLALWSGQTEGIDQKLAALPDEMYASSPALPALALAAQGKWSDGGDVFIAAARTPENDAEYRTYFALMASAFARLAGEDDAAETYLAEASELSFGDYWVSALVRGMTGEGDSEPVGENITQINEAGRICEQRFYRAFQAGIDPLRHRSLLEGCVATGVVDFVEYTVSLLRLREIDPERWDPTLAPPPAPAEEPEDDETDEDWLRGASPNWTIPS